MSRAFPLGQLIATTDVLRLCDTTGITLGPLIDRHGAGDWGDISAAEKAANDLALTQGGRLLSCYHLPHCRVCIVTAADRGQTVVMELEECKTT